ncbi:hypothetical protein GJ496_005443 [Pomphorhynchus laevis]|nr:hypothetical protein GJ496_005443 [Pomphorhynchus laevis]
MTQRRESVSYFIKLILKRVIPLKCYATILKHFVKANTHFGDILRASITMLREKFSRNDVAKLLGQALCQKDKDVFLHGEKANDTEIKVNLEFFNCCVIN